MELVRLYMGLRVSENRSSQCGTREDLEKKKEKGET
jgi:hypothetical protein